MPKGSPELTASRREEIINACEQLYQTMNFKEITVKEIGEATSFTRTSIYNYFQTKEEIFLALMQREYDLWVCDLETLMQEHTVLTPDELAHALAVSLEKRKQLLKLLAMNHYDMEENSRPENLTEFKKSYGASLNAVRNCLIKFCPDMSGTEIEQFVFVFFPFMFGVYPYAVASDKQITAMEQASVQFTMHSIYEMIYNCVRKLLERNKL